MAIPITPVSLGDTVRLKKPHPCGANEWEIARVGADIKLKCCGCGRTVMLERYEFDRRFRGFIRKAAEGTSGEATIPAEPPAEAAEPGDDVGE